MTDRSRATGYGQSPGRGRTITLWIVALVIIGSGGYGFVTKLVQFVRALETEEGGGFTIFPILNYFIVTAGFVCLLIWAVARGMFRNVERPKYTMLEREAELDRDEGRGWSE